MSLPLASWVPIRTKAALAALAEEVVFLTFRLLTGRPGPGSSPKAAKRGVEGAGLEAGPGPRDHRNGRPFRIATTALCPVVRSRPEWAAKIKAREKTYKRERDQHPDTCMWDWRDLSKPRVRQVLGYLIGEEPPDPLAA